MVRTIAVALVCCATAVMAQVHVDRDVVSSGAQAAAGAHHRLAGTVGQSVIGVTSGSTHLVEAGFWYEPLGGPTAVGELPVAAHELRGAAPNPFNPLTTIAYAVPRPTRVCLRIYDLAGRLVDTLVDQDVAAGFHSVTFDGQGLASGVYVCRMVAGSFVQTRALTLIK